MQPNASQGEREFENHLLVKAATRAVTQLGIDDTLADRLLSGADTRAVCIDVLKIWRGLGAQLGFDVQAMQAWMSAEHRTLGSKPIDLIAESSGRERIVSCIERTQFQ